MMKLFKVVYHGPHSHELTSPLVSHRYLTATYKVGEWTYPRVGNFPLFVFDNLASASNFSSNLEWSRWNEIYTCEAINPRPCEWVPLIMPGSAWKYLRDRWLACLTTRLGFEGDCHYTRTPTHSLICDAVRLLDLVVPRRGNDEHSV
jgi:hypothetical protein